jgi:hypothetical protein
MTSQLPGMSWQEPLPGGERDTWVHQASATRYFERLTPVLADFHRRRIDAEEWETQPFALPFIDAPCALVLGNVELCSCRSTIEAVLRCCGVNPISIEVPFDLYPPPGLTLPFEPSPIAPFKLLDGAMQTADLVLILAPTPRGVVDLKYLRALAHFNNRFCATMEVRQ